MLSLFSFNPILLLIEHTNKYKMTEIKNDSSTSLSFPPLSTTTTTTVSAVVSSATTRPTGNKNEDNDAAKKPHARRRKNNRDRKQTKSLNIDVGGPEKKPPHFNQQSDAKPSAVSSSHSQAAPALLYKTDNTTSHSQSINITRQISESNDTSKRRNVNNAKDLSTSLKSNSSSMNNNNNNNNSHANSKNNDNKSNETSKKTISSNNIPSEVANCNKSTNNSSLNRQMSANKSVTVSVLQSNNNNNNNNNNSTRTRTVYSNGGEHHAQHHQQQQPQQHTHHPHQHIQQLMSIPPRQSNDVNSENLLDLEKNYVFKIKNVRFFWLKEYERKPAFKTVFALDSTLTKF